jgi:hypothetical protein
VRSQAHLKGLTESTRLNLSKTHVTGAGAYRSSRTSPS